MIQRGEVCWVDLGPAVGSRPAKRRPVVVVQSDRYNESRLATAIVLVITSNTALAAMPGNVFLPAGSSGLPRDSVANVTAVLTVEKREPIERAGRLPPKLVEEIDRGLRKVLSLWAAPGLASVAAPGRAPVPVGSGVVDSGPLGPGRAPPDGVRLDLPGVLEGLQGKSDGLVGRSWERGSDVGVAQRKAGKTTLTLNLARALLTGEAFLGAFDVVPVAGDVAMLNFEVSGHTLAHWADDHAVPPERFHLVNLRGRRNPLAHDEDRQLLATWLRERGIEVLIVDPFGRAFHGASQNDSTEVGSWLVALDTFARGDVGARELVLTAHAGWDGERTRGSSSLEDWADTILTLTRGKDDDADGRYLRALGRDVDVEEDRLDFYPATRTLRRSGAGSRRAAQRARATAAARVAVQAFVQANPGCSGQTIRANVDHGSAVVDDARRALVADGTLIETRRPGRGGGSAYQLRATEARTPTNPD